MAAQTRQVRPGPGIDRLVAHRGEPLAWPENSLAGFRAVLAAGARYIETDVQLTADAVPVLSHDASLARACTRDLSILTSTYADIAELQAGFRGRFGSRFADNRIAPLSELAGLLRGWPDVTAFIELKQASILACGAERMLEAVLGALEAVLARCVLISFDRDVLLAAQRRHALPVGWVLPGWDAGHRAAADALAAQYLFIDRQQLPDAGVPLWPGPWRWVAYTCNEAGQIAALLERGFALVETDDFRRLAAALQD